MQVTGSALSLTLINTGDNLEGVHLPLLLHRPKTLFEQCKIVIGDDARVGVCAGKSNAAWNNLLVENSVKVDAFVVLDQQRVQTAY